MTCLNNAPAARHAYEIGVSINGVISRVEVRANSRAQAAAIARKHGFEVRDVNMVG